MDASALVKRYVAEEGSDLVRNAMGEADQWFCCRVGFVETARAVGLVAGELAVRRVRDEWPSFSVIEVDQSLSEDAVRLALEQDLRSLDALHLASALLLPSGQLAVATWDRRLGEAACRVGLQVVPEPHPAT